MQPGHDAVYQALGQFFVSLKSRIDSTVQCALHHVMLQYTQVWANNSDGQ